MAKFKILVIQHLLKGNGIAKSGEIVDGSRFINLQESLDGKFVVEVEAEEKDTDKTVATPLDVELKIVKSLNKDKLLDYAKEGKFAFDESLSKKELLVVVIEELESRFSTNE